MIYDLKSIKHTSLQAARIYFIVHQGGGVVYYIGTYVGTRSPVIGVTDRNVTELKRSRDTLAVGVVITWDDIRIFHTDSR